jgi:hypothetical protein
MTECFDTLTVFDAIKHLVNVVIDSINELYNVFVAYNIELRDTDEQGLIDVIVFLVHQLYVDRQGRRYTNEIIKPAVQMYLLNASEMRRLKMMHKCAVRCAIKGQRPEKPRVAPPGTTPPAWKYAELGPTPIANSVIWCQTTKVIEEMENKAT